MEENMSKLIKAIKDQAELFLLDAAEFYPFGTYINMQNEIVPVGPSSDNEHPDISSMIKQLENYLRTVKHKIAALAIEVSINENDVKYDALEIRFYDPLNGYYKQYFKYLIKDEHVDFAT